MSGKVRTFATGATRDTDEGKLDYEGFLSPLVLKRFAHYMHKHRQQSDGSLRDSDNWQKGIPREQYMKSLIRHVFELWETHREGKVDTETACAIMFNIQGYILEVYKDVRVRMDELLDIHPVDATPNEQEKL